MGALDETSLNTVLRTANSKRRTTTTIVEYTPRVFGKHFKLAEKVNANIFALIGEKELKNGTIYVKNLDTKEEKTIKLEDF